MSIRSSDSDPLRVEFQPTESDFLGFCRHVYFRQQRQTKRLVYFLLGFIVFLEGWVFVNQGWLQALQTLSPLATICASLIFLRFYQAKRSFREVQKSARTHIVTISSTGMTLTTHCDSADVAWSAVTSIEQTATLVLLLTSNANGIYIPKSAFSSQEQCAMFVQTAMDMRKSSSGKTHAPTKLPDDTLANVVFQNSLDDLTYLNRIAQSRTATGRRARLGRLIIPVIVFIVAAAPEAGHIFQDHDFPTLLPLFFAALTAAVLLMILANPRARARAVYNRQDKNQPQSIIISKTGLNHVTAQSNIEQSWSNVTNIICDPDGRTVFILFDLTAYGVPPSAFVSLENAQRFQSLVTRLWKGEEAPVLVNEPQSTESVWPPSPSQIVE